MQCCTLQLYKWTQREWRCGVVVVGGWWSLLYEFVLWMNGETVGMRWAKEKICCLCINVSSSLLRKETGSYKCYVYVYTCKHYAQNMYWRLCIHTDGRRGDRQALTDGQICDIVRERRRLIAMWPIFWLQLLLLLILLYIFINIYENYLL